ncbi:MAG: hypothetical protein K6B41_07670 [Butyrivibrio sp.]|nr:hypothetical protein [Butyrivibrio sp.]
MPGIVSYTSIDYISPHLVPVIASFDTAGEIRPLYVRIDNKSRKIHSYRIKNKFRNSIDFECQVEYEDRIVRVIVSYYKSEDVWGIPSE